MPRSYTDRTLKLLWGRSGGRCAMPKCRVELIVDATDYDPIVIIGEIAHGAAAGDGGPRAMPELSNRERNDYSNLILLCPNCHTRFDRQPKTYSVERWKEIKASHEAWVRASLPERGRSLTGWTVLGLKSEYPIDLATACEAISPDFIAAVPQWLQVPTETPDWRATDQAIAQRARELMAEGDSFDQRLAVFPLAPVSACLSLGFHLTNRPNVRLFQYHRDDRSWAWPRRLAPAQDITVSGLDGEDQNCRAVAFLFHYSAIITDAEIAGLRAAVERRVDFRVPHPSIAWLQHPDQIKWSALEARRAFERAVQLFPNARIWHVFYAGPAPIAVALGQQINPTMCPRVQLYEYDRRDEPPYRASIQLTK
jgi:SMODS-associated and fused to various effectors sensor domain/HNH endonuclease